MQQDGEMTRWFAILFFCGTAHAHDFWIEPSTFRPARGELVAVSLRVGQNFVGDPIARSASLIESFVVRDEAGERRINGFENRDPAGYVTALKPGTIVVGYRSKPSPLELTPEKFALFLREEGFTTVRASGTHKETFSRFAKAILGTDFARAGDFGWRFEIVPVDRVRFRVVLEGKPYANGLVTAMHRDDARASVSVRTDRAGVATLPLAKNGVWLVKAVALIPPKANRAEWETLWASLTFER